MRCEIKTEERDLSLDLLFSQKRICEESRSHRNSRGKENVGLFRQDAGNNHDESSSPSSASLGPNGKEKDNFFL